MFEFRAEELFTVDDSSLDGPGKQAVWEFRRVILPLSDAPRSRKSNPCVVFPARAPVVDNILILTAKRLLG